MSEWIKCSERLPKKGQYVLLCADTIKQPFVGYLDFNARVQFIGAVNQACYYTQGPSPIITHWQPMPEPPGD
jgi:hypothetical protein